MLSFREYLQEQTLLENSTWFHGTSSKYLASIRRKGLLPSDTNDEHPGATLWLYHQNPLKGLMAAGQLHHGVYITQNKALAKAFADVTTEVVGGEPVILSLSLPHFQGEKDEADAIGAAYVYPNTIPSKYIKNVEQGLNIHVPGNPIQFR